MRLELTTSSLPRRCSTTELPGHNLIRADLHLWDGNIGAGDRGRTGDIQLGRLTLYQLSYTRMISLSFSCPGGGWWVRTTVGISRQIYSLLPLATRATLPDTMPFSVELAMRLELITAGLQNRCSTS